MAAATAQHPADEIMTLRESGIKASFWLHNGSIRRSCQLPKL
jgi:hypothetical protein